MPRPGPQPPGPWDDLLTCGDGSVPTMSFLVSGPMVGGKSEHQPVPKCSVDPVGGRTKSLLGRTDW